jgi:hypothetical protein
VKIDIKEAVIFMLAVIVVIFGFKYYTLLHTPSEDSYLEQTKHLRIIIEAKEKQFDLYKNKAQRSLAAADSIRAKRQKAKTIFYEKVDHTLHLNDSDTYELFMRNFAR